MYITPFSSGRAPASAIDTRAGIVSDAGSTLRTTVPSWRITASDQNLGGGVFRPRRRLNFQGAVSRAPSHSNRQVRTTRPGHEGLAPKSVLLLASEMLTAQV